jgi:hypothetical protein
MEFVEFSYYRKDIQQSVPLLINVAHVVALAVDPFGHPQLEMSDHEEWSIEGTYQEARAKLRGAGNNPPRLPTLSLNNAKAPTRRTR